MYAPIPPDPKPYIPDCLGIYSPFLDPLHDSFGRELVTCFLVDRCGNVAIFLNRREFNYVPYNTLFNLEEYNECLSLLFNDDVALPPQKIIINNISYVYSEKIKKFAIGKISFKEITTAIMKGRIFDGIHGIYDLLHVCYIMFSKKYILHSRFHFWKVLKKYYQNKGVYVYAPHEKLNKLVKIYSPYKKSTEKICNLAKKVGQSVPISLSEEKYIDFDFLKLLWIKQARQSY